MIAIIIKHQQMQDVMVVNKTRHCDDSKELIWRGAVCVGAPLVVTVTQRNVISPYQCVLMITPSIPSSE